MDFFYLKYVLLVLYINELSVHYKPIETTQRFGQSNGATVNHASDHRRAQEERQLWQSEKKIYSSPFEAEWAVLNHRIFHARLGITFKWLAAATLFDAAHRIGGVM